MKQAAKTVDQIFAETLLRAGQIRGRVHGSENVVLRHLAVECSRQSPESILTDGGVNIVFLQNRIAVGVPPAGIRCDG